MQFVSCTPTCHCRYYICQEFGLLLILVWWALPLSGSTVNYAQLLNAITVKHFKSLPVASYLKKNSLVLCRMTRNSKLLYAESICPVPNTSEYSIWRVWRMLLEESNNLALSRIRASEAQQRLHNELKPLKTQRISVSKRVLEQLRILQVRWFVSYLCASSFFRKQSVFSVSVPIFLNRVDRIDICGTQIFCIKAY